MTEPKKEPTRTMQLLAAGKKVARRRELQKIHHVMATDRAKYNADVAMQARYRELLEIRDRELLEMQERDREPADKAH